MTLSDTNRNKPAAPDDKLVAREAIAHLRAQAAHFRMMAAKTVTKRVADMLIAKSEECERGIARLEHMPAAPVSQAGALNVIKRPSAPPVTGTASNPPLQSRLWRP